MLVRKFNLVVRVERETRDEARRTRVRQSVRAYTRMLSGFGLDSSGSCRALSNTAPDRSWGVD